MSQDKKYLSAARLLELNEVLQTIIRQFLNPPEHYAQEDYAHIDRERYLTKYLETLGFEVGEE